MLNFRCSRRSQPLLAEYLVTIPRNPASAWNDGADPRALRRVLSLDRLS
jgi:hypothetical protein